MLHLIFEKQEKKISARLCTTNYNSGLFRKLKKKTEVPFCVSGVLCQNILI